MSLKHDIVDNGMTWRAFLPKLYPIIFIDQSGSTLGNGIGNAITHTAKQVGTFFLEVAKTNLVHFVPFSSNYIEVIYRSVDEINLSDKLKNGVAHSTTRMYDTVLDVLRLIQSDVIPFIIVLSDGYDDYYRSSGPVLQKISDLLSKFEMSFFCIVFFGPNKSQVPIDVNITNDIDVAINEFDHYAIGTMNQNHPDWKRPICLNRDENHNHLCHGCTKRTDSIPSIHYYNQQLREDFKSLLNTLKTRTQVHLFYSDVKNPIDGNMCVVNVLITTLISFLHKKYCTLRTCYVVKNDRIHEVLPSNQCTIPDHIPKDPQTRCDLYNLTYLLKSFRSFVQTQNLCLCGSSNPIQCTGLLSLPHVSQTFKDMCTWGLSCKYAKSKLGCRNGKNHDVKKWETFFRALLVRHNRQINAPIKIEGFTSETFPDTQVDDWKLVMPSWQLSVIMYKDGTHRSNSARSNSARSNSARSNSAKDKCSITNFDILPFDIVNDVMSYLTDVLEWTSIKNHYYFKSGSLCEKID